MIKKSFLNILLQLESHHFAAMLLENNQNSHSANNCLNLSMFRMRLLLRRKIQVFNISVSSLFSHLFNYFEAKLL